MAKWTIKHACGHDAVHHLSGSLKDRERKEAWMAEQVCPECRRAEQAQANEAAQAANAEAGLPALEGTPKQIAWAETIRAGIVQQVEQVRSKLAEAGGLDKLRADGPAEKIAALERQLACIEVLLGKTSASWWIDHRTQTLPQLLQAVAGEIA